jgi:hypothetical protein
MAQIITSGSDIIVQAKNGDLLAVAEVRNWKEIAYDDAALIRRDLVASNRLNAFARFFIVIARHTGYLWDQNARPVFEDDAPFVAFPASPILEHYLPSAIETDSLRRESYKSAIIQWLWDVAGQMPRRPLEPERVIGEFVDFAGEMRNARVDSGLDD